MGDFGGSDLDPLPGPLRPEQAEVVGQHVRVHRPGGSSSVGVGAAAFHPEAADREVGPADRPVRRAEAGQAAALVTRPSVVASSRDGP